MQADGWNKGQMLKAFKESWGAFVNTNTEDPVSVTLISMIASLRDQLVGSVSAAKAKGLELRISTLPATKVHGRLWFLITALITTKRAT